MLYLDSGASENLRGLQRPQFFNQYKEKINKLDLDHLKTLTPMAIFDFGYWDNATWASDDDARLLDNLKSLLFPHQNWNEQLEINSTQFNRRINKLCDVVGMWCHIKYENDIFLTGDRNFHANATALERMGAQKILNPLHL